MVGPNGNESSATYFILIGLPGLEEAQFWLAFPLCSLYLIAVLGNLTIIYIVRTEHSLHEPTRNVGAKGARFFPWGADAFWQSTCLKIHQLTLPSSAPAH